MSTTLLHRFVVVAIAAFGVLGTYQLWGFTQTAMDVQAASMQPAWQTSAPSSPAQYVVTENIEQPNT